MYNIYIYIYMYIYIYIYIYPWGCERRARMGVRDLGGAPFRHCLVRKTTTSLLADRRSNVTFSHPLQSAWLHCLHPSRSNRDVCGRACLAYPSLSLGNLLRRQSMLCVCLPLQEGGSMGQGLRFGTEKALRYGMPACASPPACMERSSGCAHGYALRELARARPV